MCWMPAGKRSWFDETSGAASWGLPFPSPSCDSQLIRVLLSINPTAKVPENRLAGHVTLQLASWRSQHYQVFFQGMVYSTFIISGSNEHLTLGHLVKDT